MNRGRMLHSFVVLALLATGLSCGRGETPEERLEEIRLDHSITPVGYTTIVDPDTGQPRLVVDLRVVNEGVQPLEQLTVLVRVVPADGSPDITRRVTLALDDLRPGIGVQMSTTVPGLKVGEDDEVFVEIEHGLSPEELRQLPEWQAVS